MNVLLLTYIEDLRDNLIIFDDALIKLKKNTKDTDAINSLFRVAHTIKGNSAAIKILEVEKVMHNMEDVLQEVRTGTRELSQLIIDTLYMCHDFLDDFMGQLEEVGENFVVNTESLLNQILKIQNKEQDGAEKADKSASKRKSSSSEPKSESVSLSEDTILKDIPQETWRLVLENMKRGLTAYYIDIELDDEAQMKETWTWMVFQTVSNYGNLIYSKPELSREADSEFYPLTVEDKIRMIVLFERDLSELQKSLKLIDLKKTDFIPLDTEQVSGFIASNNKDAIDSKETNKSEAIATIDNITGTVEYEEEHLPTKIDNKAAKENLSSEVKTAQTIVDGGIIRIPINKVDNLLDMLSELMILKSQVVQLIETHLHGNTEVLNNLSRFAKLMRTIQNLSMSLRLIEIKNTLHRLSRIARETAQGLNKQVSISIVGEETEIDRSAAEKLFDPLMHLVRNAVSHGIESPEDRVAAGKPAEGNVEIKAYSKRGNVYVEVNDDGKGINPDEILKKAIRLGMANETDSYSPEEIIKFIFKPGFSTQEQVNNISGRGVGMNVVESELAKIGGKVEIVNNIGKGCSFILRIPMNLAVINGTIVEISGERYIIPTLYIKEFFILKDELLSVHGKKRAIRLRDRIIPVISEKQILGNGSDELSNQKEIIILEMDHRFLALPVDHILGRQDIISKPLGYDSTNVDIISGASILGDGKVSLILDVEMMFKLVGM